MVVPTISRFVGMMTAGAAGSAYYRYCHSKPALKRVATCIYPSAPALRFPYSNPIIQSLASRIYPIGRAFFNTAYRMIKSWLPKMPVLGSLTYVNVEKIEGQEKIERIVYPFFFRVTGKDILPDQKVYVLGTNHSFKEADYPPEALALIKACDLLLSEYPAEMALAKNPKEWQLQDAINTHLHVHKKLLSTDAEWFRTIASVHETMYGPGLNLDVLISYLKKLSSEIKEDQACWLDRISLADQTKIQTVLDQCELQLRDLDPLSVRFSLQIINQARDCTRDFNSGEKAILNNFHNRNRPIIELEEKLNDSIVVLEPRMGDIRRYDLEATLKDILLELEPKVEKAVSLKDRLLELKHDVEEGQQRVRKLQEVAKEEAPCKLDKLESLQSQLESLSSLLAQQLSELESESSKQALLDSILDGKTRFNFEEFEKEMLTLPGFKDWTVSYRNKTWLPKIPAAIQQKKNMAVIGGAFHLLGETGMVRSLRREGYDVKPVKALEE
jgi:hypothetical protein